jgi:hypothetical protein
VVSGVSVPDLFGTVVGVAEPLGVDVAGVDESELDGPVVDVVSPGEVVGVVVSVVVVVGVVVR